MNASFRLRQRREAVPATALFLPSPDVGTLLELCASLSLDPEGRVFLTAEGFLILLPGEATSAAPGTIRLRSVAPHLFVPANADLIPSLQENEARDLCYKFGLIFLPWNVVLRFSPHSPLELSALLAFRVSPRAQWTPFPTPISLAKRLVEIEAELPESSEFLGLDENELNTKVDELLPGSGGTTSGILGGASFQLGNVLMWLGQNLRWKQLATLGAQWAGKGLNASPQLSEKILGRQASALRALLREFREGDQEKALKHAIPLTGSGSPQGGRPSTDYRLPTNRLLYSLQELLKPNPRGGATYWQTEDDVIGELRRLYMKAAAQAIQAGDYRRAAYIQGNLLHDYRAAARSLTLGHLHHDAAMIQLQKLNDPKAAAQAFEAAGELDRALQLYRKLGDHQAAGDVLSRLDDEESALLEYRLAAQDLINKGNDYLQAGRLMQDKAHRNDEALEWFMAGWSKRPGANDLVCAREAISSLAPSGPSPALETLLNDVDHFLREPGRTDQAAKHYEFVVQLSKREEFASERANLQDRSLIGLATKLRQETQHQGRLGSLVSDLFGKSNVWPAPLLNDADYAAKNMPRESVPTQSRHPVLPRIPIHQGTITAVCSASDSDDVFVGFDDGSVFRFHAQQSEVLRISGADLTVKGISAHPDGESLVVLREDVSGVGQLSSYAWGSDRSFRLVFRTSVEQVSDAWLTPILPQEGESLVGVWDGSRLNLLNVPSLAPKGALDFTASASSPTTAILLEEPSAAESCAVLFHDGQEWVASGRDGRQIPTHFRSPSLTSLSVRLRALEATSPIDPPDYLEIVGVAPLGNIHWASFQLASNHIDLIAHNHSGRLLGYLAATIMRPGLVAGVMATRIHWLRPGGSTFTTSTTKEFDLQATMACCPNRFTDELLLINRHGWIEKIPLFTTSSPGQPR